MSSIWIVAMALAAPPSENGPLASSGPAAAATRAAEPRLRSGRELEAAVHAALRQWGRPPDAEMGLAAREVLALYVELGQDRELASATREQLRSRVRGRLTCWADRIARRIARENRLAKAKKPKSVETPPDKSETLAQRGAGAAAPGAAGGFPGQVGIAGPGLGGQVAPGLQGALGLRGDGQDLVDLIRSTIAPSSWDVNGGHGSIYYWRPSPALVVGQTSEVHEDIHDLLNQLRRTER